MNGITPNNFKKNEIMKITDRVKAPSPKFFKVLRNIGLALAAVGGTILAAPIALPVVVTMVGGYLAVAGGVITAVSQLTTVEEETAKAAEPSGDKAGLRQAQPDIPEDDNW